MPAADRSGGAGLYLHIPFCSAICPYCDFSVLTGGAEARERFVHDLLREIELWSPEREGPRRDGPGRGEGWSGAAFDTVYLGGGTPSALAPEQLGRILAAVAQHLPVVAEPWIQLEANPEDVEPSTLQAWRRLGIDTVSLGVQSFDPHALAFLGRRHDGETARRSVSLAQDAGFHTVSLDLIFGWPEQTPERWEADLEQALALAPQHLSCYQLTLHEGTPFGFRQRRGELREMPEDQQAVLFIQAHERLAAGGLVGYEVSNFARSPEHQSRHNRKYWHHVPYLGLGPSAHSFDGRRRWWNVRKVGPWQRQLQAGQRPVDEVEQLGPQELALEAVFLGLRTARGLDLDWVEELSGLDLEPANAVLFEAWEERGQVRRPARWRGRRLVPTLEGWAVADALAAAVETDP
ncbi:MAG: radical SAM family heme chaperone HemW [Acidobacteriota bacterium]|nr:radical SAM family heme chaperone HemW [Acidobacteriota bacterium]